MRLIDADALKIVAQGKNHHRRYIWADITDAPTIEAEPVRRGRWKMTLRYMPASEISDTASQSFYFAECSVCGWQRRFSEKYKWCPHCGARMDHEVE